MDIGIQVDIQIDIQRASIENKPILRNLMELYQYDFSEFDGTDVDEHGLFGYRWLDHYWTDPQRHPFIIKVSDKLAGFVLVRAIGEDTHSIAEFFILKKYRHRGIGQAVAYRIFDMFPGKWRVMQEERNFPAQAFWRKVISRYTDGKFAEVQDDEWNGPIQEFMSRGEIKSKDQL